MSLWRRHALELLPELRQQITDPDVDSIYALFRELSWLAGRAVDNEERDLLRRIMEYAVWCYRHRSHDVRNAVRVVFYESLGGNLKVVFAAREFIPDDVLAGMWDLWEHILSEQEFEDLSALLGRARR
jgi:hypothetical protein